jgi:hypothetical protein
MPQSSNLGRKQAEALGQSMVYRWLDNGWGLLAELISRNVPTNSFSPRAIRNRFAISSAICSIAHV